jgi:hypothetical protein
MKLTINGKKWEMKKLTYAQRISSISRLGIFRRGSAKKAPSCGVARREGGFVTGSCKKRRTASKMAGSDSRATM